MKNSITDVPGIEVGHAQDEDALTGCTVILARKGAVAGVDQRGGAPGTRETDLLSPFNLVSTINAILLSGGSAFGLDAATGVMRYLEEQKLGFDTGVARVPIVPAAVLYDLALGSADIRPDAEMGYRAAQAASAKMASVGNIGAGMGATVGKILGVPNAMKAGMGTASMEIGGGIIVGAIVAVNAFGDVVSPQTGAILAGVRSAQVGPIKIGEEGGFADTLHVMQTIPGRTVMKLATRANTVIGAIATNAKLTKAEAGRVAQMAQDGLARTIRPAHTMLDGDTIFALSTGSKKADVSTVGAFAAEVLMQAILRGTQSAASLGGVPGLGD
ncbi:MAG: P1 family peptidase [Anaerolineae bacterium]|jgi:L-aminopeptidase/D-esterase-like protein|nr:P1 family peptidase [Anaerolineae bacterium]MBT7072033.1 P1 family peptidase [Anaerolineae bacterium]MBT7326603.1 P1 family peptidase [Anaerolineae bacterium]